MTTQEDFIAASVRYQVGDMDGLRLSVEDDALALAQSASSGMALRWDHETGQPGALNGWRLEGHILRKDGARVNRQKVADGLFGILKHQPDHSFLVDMADHRTRSLTTQDNRLAPVFCFNRFSGRQTGRILWPLSIYHDLESPEFLGGLNPGRIPWAEKMDKCVWRGGPGNRGRMGKHARGKSVRMMPLLKSFKSGNLTQEETETALMSMSRYRVVKSFIDDPQFDVGFTNSDGFLLQNEPFLDQLERPRLTRETCQTYKYILVLPGNDVASNFYWVMNSGSLGLVMGCEFETFASGHFRPWEHYVPFRRDLRDFRRNLNWCENHPEECQQMIARASEVCRMLADGDLRQTILGQVVAEVGRKVRG